MRRLAFAWVATVLAVPALAAPGARDRVYTADQNSNTVSVIDPTSNMLLGQVRLGNPRPDVLSPLYRGEVNVHGLGFSPDHRTLIAVSTVTNSVTFIDTQSNKVKGIAYIGRNPHEGFFTPDGKEVWVTVRGEDHLAVIDPNSFKETGRIPTTGGPGMVIFSPDGKLAFVCNSFNAVLEVVDVAKRQVVKKIPVVSPFSPFVQVTPDGSEAWLTHKDVGKVTRIDVATLAVKGVIDTGFITNHLAFARSSGETLAYVTVGGENVVKVFTTAAAPRLVATIPVGALPHGAWASGDRSRVYVGLENDDAVVAIDTATNQVVARIPVGQAPQALVYVPDAVQDDGAGTDNLTAAVTPSRSSINVQLKPTQKGGRGFVVSRNLGLVDVLEVNLFGLKADAVYRVYAGPKTQAVVALRTNANGAASASAIGPIRDIAGLATDGSDDRMELVVMEGDAEPSRQGAVLRSE